MPTIITHGIVAVAAGKAFAKRRMPLRFWILSVVCSVIPDADAIGFSLGVRYGDFFGHRGIFHSIFFAFILSLFVVLTFFRNCRFFSRGWWKFVLFFFTVGASHGILDAFTSGGLGIALLSPFDNTRYFFPWTPIRVSPIGLGAFFSNWGLQVMISEITYIWMPLFVLLVGVRIMRSKSVGQPDGVTSKGDIC